METTISSPFTWYEKFAKPFMLFGLLNPILICGILTDPGFLNKYSPVLFLFLVVDIFGYWYAKGIKKVEVATNFLYITDFKNTIRIPLSEIVQVTENEWIPGRLVWIHFRHPTEFGKKIMFIPAIRGVLPFQPHPIVFELKSLAGMERKSISDLDI